MPNGGEAGTAAPLLEGRLSVFDTIGNSIDDLVKTVTSIPKVVKEAAYYTYYTTKAAAGLGVAYALGGVPALIFPFGVMGGAALGKRKNKEKITFKDMANELAVGGVLGGLLHCIFLGNNALGKIVKSSYGTLASLVARGGYAMTSIPPFLTTHECLNRALIKDYKPKPLKNTWKQTKRLWPIIPALLANYTFVPEYLGPAYQMPVAAGISTGYALLKADNKKEEKAPETHKLPQPAEPYAMPKAA